MNAVQNTMTTRYEIRVRGQLDPRVSTWFEGFSIAHTPDGDTLLAGNVVDQAALHGVLARFRDLGITLLSINPLAGDPAAHKTE